VIPQVYIRAPYHVFRAITHVHSVLFPYEFSACIVAVRGSLVQPCSDCNGEILFHKLL